MTALCVTPIKGTVMRTIKLDVCGNPVSGASGSVVASNGFISIKADPQYEDGTEFTQKLANGSLCVNQKDQGQLKRVALDNLFCVMDPDQIVQLTGSRENLNGVTGTGVFFNDSMISAQTSLEIWQQVAGRNACNAFGQQQYVYWCFPYLVNAQIKAFTVENANLQFEITAETRGVGALFGALPTVLPPNGYLSPNVFNIGEHYAYNVTTVAPPAATCGAVVLV